MFVFARSVLCILVTSIKNIYDSKTKNIIELPPTNEHEIQDVNKALRNKTAFKYFEKYIEAKYYLNDQSHKEFVENTFNFRFLELYMDLREYYNIMIKIQENKHAYATNGLE